MAVLHFSKISYALTDLPPDEDSKNYAQVLEVWKSAYKLCLNTISNALFNDLFDVYAHYDVAKDLWNELISKNVF